MILADGKLDITHNATWYEEGNYLDESFEIILNKESVFLDTAEAYALMKYLEEKLF